MSEPRVLSNEEIENLSWQASNLATSKVASDLTLAWGVKSLVVTIGHLMTTREEAERRLGDLQTALRDLAWGQGMMGGAR